MSGVDSLLVQARAAHTDRSALQEIAARALAQETAVADLTEIGIVLRDHGLRAESLAVLERATAIAPTDLHARYETAILYLREGSHLRSLQLLRQAVLHHPHDERANLLAARILHGLGAHRDASAHLDRVPILGADRADWERQVRIVHAFGRYVAEFPKSWAIQAAQESERSTAHLTVQRVAERVRAALDARTGFSLVRVGDGEGAFIRFGNVDEARFAELYAHNRRDRAGVWFAGSVDPNGAFLADAIEIIGVMERADVVGMPYPGWLEHEHKLLSMTGITALTNLLRVARQPGQHTCTQLIHIDLHNTKLLYEIMRGQRRIGLISCHRDLVDRLGDAFGYDEVEYHHVPGEKGHGHLLTPDATAGTHWPDRYREITQALARPLDGRLFVVAAGILGKLYCDRIKRSGGVALDVGSLADGWMGVRTRPDLGELEIA